MLKAIQKLFFQRNKQPQGATEKQWTIERTKRNRRRVREKMCSVSSATTCPEMFSSGRTLTPEDILAVEKYKNTPVIVASEHEEKDWWVPKESEQGEDEKISLEFSNKGLKLWEARRKEWLKRSAEDESRRRPVKIEKSLSMIVSICNDFDWSESDRHDSDSW